VRSSTGPSKIRESVLQCQVKDGKGSGDYGVFAFGVQWSNPQDRRKKLARGNQSKLPVCYRQSDHRAWYQAYTGKWALEAKSLLV
jgi:hypothetical protein